MHPDKPFLTIEELLAHLQNDYGLRSITHPDFAKNAIFKFSYYDLVNGYQDVLIKDGKFEDQISIEYLYLFHLFDKELQNIIFKYSIMIENYFKNVMAYYISQHCGVFIDDYLNPKYYYANKAGVNFNELKDKIINYNIKGDGAKQQPIKHYLKNHNHVPAWILFKNLDFGKSINLFTLLRNPMKTDITNKLMPYKLSASEKTEFLICALNLIRKFRNKIAHNLKFVTYKAQGDYLSAKVLKATLPPVLYGPSEKAAKCGRNDVYAVILSIIILLKDDSYLINKFISEFMVHITSLDETVVYENLKPMFFNKYSDITGLPKTLAQKFEALYTNTNKQ